MRLPSSDEEGDVMSNAEPAITLVRARQQLFSATHHFIRITAPWTPRTLFSSSAPAYPPL